MAINVLVFPEDETNKNHIGGKAYALWKLGREFPVPPWFAVPPEAVSNGQLNEGLDEFLTEAIKRVDADRFAVRSSAVDEDGTDSSFAGQYESFLNVPSAHIKEHIAKVWNSAFADHVLEYRRQRGLQESPSAPAVLIQKMVNADTSGVAFTADPLTSDTSRLTVIAVKGLADKLVSGEESGDTYYVDREGKPEKKEPIGQESILSDKQIEQIAKLAIKAEKHFGNPQDIEWAIEGGDIYLVQSRPITTLENNEETIIWDNSNIVESYSGVTSPLTFSFARRAYTEVYKSFSSLMGVTQKEIRAKDAVFANMLGSVYGHVYYNLLNWYRVLALYPGFTLNRAFMEKMMGVSEALPDSLANKIAPQKEGTFAKLRDLTRLTRTLFRLIGNAFILKYRIRAFYRRLDRVMATPDPPLERRSLLELGNYYRLLEKELLSHWYTPIINDFLCMVAFGVSQGLLKRWCGDHEGQTLHNDFMIGQGDIISAEPAQRIQYMADIARPTSDVVDKLVNGDPNALKDLPELQTEFENYVDKFGDRCTQELKLESLTLDEDPTTLLQAIGFTAKKARKSHATTSKEPEKRLNIALRSKPIRKTVARFWVHWAKSRIRDRENLRFERTRVFGRVRKTCLQIGKRLVNQKLILQDRDIFFLTIEEILGLIEGTSVTYNLKEVVAIRRSEAQDFQKKGELPNRFETTGAVMPYILKHPPRQAGPVIQESGNSLKGLGCCTGIVKAKVRVVLDPRSESLQSGEILVAKHTDPGWIALFSNASGILVERGSLLSHSAIVAREMGIPAIVAVPGIMQWLKTGDVVEMDGKTGNIVKVNDEQQ